MTSRSLAALNRKNAILKVLSDRPALTYEAIGDMFHVSNRRVSQIAVQAGIRRAETLKELRPKWKM